MGLELLILQDQQKRTFQYEGYGHMIRMRNEGLKDDLFDRSNVKGPLTNMN